MEVLTGKLVTLLALVMGQRIQTLSLIKLSNIIKRDNVVQIKISDTIKPSGRDRAEPLLTFSRFEARKKICVVTTLESYTERTDSIRGGEDSLFLALKKPFQKVSSQTLSRWIKKVLSNSSFVKKRVVFGIQHTPCILVSRKAKRIRYRHYKKVGWMVEGITNICALL